MYARRAIGRFALGALASGIGLGIPFEVPAAERLEVRLGGFYEQWFGYAGNSIEVPKQSPPLPLPGDAYDFDVQQDSEIHFSGEGTTDSGITFGIQVELEAATTEDQLDESFIYLEGAFGLFNIGAVDAPASLMHFAIPDVGFDIDDGDVPNWFVYASDSNLNRTFSSLALDDAANKLSYYTPRISGFQAGISYAPDSRKHDDNFPTELRNNPPPLGDGEATFEQVMTFGLNYDNEFGDFTVQTNVGYAFAGDSNLAAGDSRNDPQTFNLGLNLGWREWVFGAAFGYYSETAPEVDNGWTTGAGVVYGSGPWAVSFSGIYGQVGATGGFEDDEQWALVLSGLYALAPGFEVRTSGFYGERDGSITEDALVGTGNGGTPYKQNAAGFGLIGGFVLTF